MSNYDIRFENLEKIKNQLYGTGDQHHSRKRKQSNFYITLNTQQTPTRDLKKLFKFVTETFFENIDKFIITNKGYPTDDERTISILPRIEVGGKYHRLHFHATVEVEHYSSIKLDLTKIRQFFRNSLDFDGEIHLFVDTYYKSRMTDEDRIKSYILKTFGNEGERKFKKGYFRGV